MVPRLPLLALAGALMFAGQARADDMEAADAYLAITGLAPGGRVPAGAPRPLEARVVALGAVVYYTVEGAAFRVVTTLGTDHEGATAPVRLVSYLAPGQRAEVSVADPAGAGPATLELAHDGGRLVVRPAPAGPQG